MSTHGETITKAKLTYLCGEEVTWGGTRRTSSWECFVFKWGEKYTGVCFIVPPALHILLFT